MTEPASLPRADGATRGQSGVLSVGAYSHRPAGTECRWSPACSGEEDTVLEVIHRCPRDRPHNPGPSAGRTGQARWGDFRLWTA